jgi:hypothetical protein
MTVRWEYAEIRRVTTYVDCPPGHGAAPGRPIMRQVILVQASTAPVVIWEATKPLKMNSSEDADEFNSAWLEAVNKLGSDGWEVRGNRVSELIRRKIDR